MPTSQGRKYEGHSDQSFAEAARNAWKDYKGEHYRRSQAPEITFRVTNMYVKASNPIHDYIVELEQIEP